MCKVVGVGSGLEGLWRVLGDPNHQPWKLVRLSAAGALGASLVGHLADCGQAWLAATTAWLLVIVSWQLLAGGTDSIADLIAGMRVFDLGAQSIQLSNQHAIYTAHPTPVGGSPRHR